MMIEWLFSFHPKNKNKDYVQGWYCIGIGHGSKYRKRRAVLEFMCRLFTGHELSTTEWGWRGGEMVDGHCRWCDKAIKMPVSEARFRYKSFNEFGVRTKFEVHVEMNEQTEPTNAEIRIMHDHAEKQRCRFGFVTAFNAHKDRGVLLVRIEAVNDVYIEWVTDKITYADAMAKIQDIMLESRGET